MQDGVWREGNLLPWGGEGVEISASSPENSVEGLLDTQQQSAT